VRYSILLATLDRTSELAQFLASLASQTWRDFELIIIDQNPDDRLRDLLAQYSPIFAIRRIRSARGHSRGFNAGLAEVTGDIVAFPDDDCWYDADLLERVARKLSQHPEWSGLTGREIVEAGFNCGGRWDAEPGRVSRANIWRRAITFSIFLRADAARKFLFDESLGVGAGTPWGAGEETDYLLRMIESGHAIHYDPGIAIWHQGRSGPYTVQICSKARRYGMGMGRVLRKHRFSLATVGRQVARPAAGALLSLLSGDLAKARYHWSIFGGRAAGWLFTPEESVATRSPATLVSSGEDAR
jgi:glycosyltransferase involved in cell wall biosynthesis